MCESPEEETIERTLIHNLSRRIQTRSQTAKNKNYCVKKQHLEIFKMKQIWTKERKVKNSKESDTRNKKESDDEDELNINENQDLLTEPPTIIKHNVIETRNLLFLWKDDLAYSWISMGNH